MRYALLVCADEKVALSGQERSRRQAAVASFEHQMQARGVLLAISQRPISGVAFGEKAPTPAWRTRPSWAVLPTADGAIHPDVHRFSYDRMGATVTVVEGASHVVMLSRPAVVADVVRQAGRSCTS